MRLACSDMSTGLIYNERFLHHDTGPGHPERPDRLRAIVAALRSSGLWDRLQHLEFDAATPSRIERLHSPAYVHRVIETCASGMSYVDVADSAVCEASAELAMLAVGGVLRAVDAVMAGEIDNAFCAVRPPGHHAEMGRSMGFCLFGSVALAAESLIADHGLDRVAIVDFDVHHGNGTQHLLEDQAAILFVSIHEDPRHQYPGTGFAQETGRGEGRGATLNVPLPSGSGDHAYRTAFDEIIIPQLDEFAPQFVLLSAGFDAATADPLGGMRVTTPGFVEITRQMIAVADRHAAGHLVSVLEGGYDLDALAAAACGHVLALLESGGG